MPHCPDCGCFMQRVKQEYEDEGICETYWGCIKCADVWTETVITLN